MKTVIASARGKRAAKLTDGGNPALNFINTHKKNRKGILTDSLAGYSDFLYWCQETNLIDWNTLLELDFERHCNEYEAELIYCEAITARNCLDELFNCLAGNEPVHPLVFDRFNGWVGAIQLHLRYEMSPVKPELHWYGIDKELGFPLWLIIASAVKLIDRGDTYKIKKCPLCGSLFMDLSRSNNRRWCNTRTCGTLQKSNNIMRKINKKLISI